MFPHRPRFSGERSLRRVPLQPLPRSRGLRDLRLSPACPGASPAGPARPPRLSRTDPWAPAGGAPDRFLFVAFAARGWVVSFPPRPWRPPPHHFHTHPPPPTPPPPRQRCPSSRGSLSHTCPCRPRGAARAPLPAGGRGQRSPLAASPCALPGAPGGGRRWPSRGALLFWVLCVINVGPPHSNQAHYKFLRARGRKSCAPPLLPFPHSFTSYLSFCFFNSPPPPPPPIPALQPGF